MSKASLLVKMHQWEKIRENFVARKFPLTTLHWRFLFPKSINADFRIHRYVFLNAFKGYPKALIFCGMFIVQIKWWGYFAWKAIYRAYKHANNQCFKHHQIAKQKQLTDLFKLAFVYSIPPFYYYKYQLHKTPSKSWLKYAYNFQASSWHRALSYKNSQQANKLIYDKLAFEKFLIQKNISASRSLLHINAGETLSLHSLQSLSDDLFFKPRIGSQCKGCFLLRQTNSDDNPRPLAIIKFGLNNSSQYINTDELGTMILASDYLIQPVYKNHRDLTELFGTDELIVVRLISVLYDNNCCAISAILEIPDNHNYPVSFYNLSINIENGVILPASNTKPKQNKFLNDKFQHCIGQFCPGWREMHALCIKAHLELPAMLTIGWDVSYTNDGPLIIEANSRWNLEKDQIVTGKPILETKIAKLYLDFIEHN